MSQSGSDAVIRVHNLVKRFRKVEAVRGIDFDVRRGEVFGFLGPNGAGKTTTIAMLLGLVYPTAGTVEILGQKVTPNHNAALRRVGSMVGQPGLSPFLTGRTQLRLLARVEPDITPAHVEEALELVDLQGAAGRPVRTYSTGMKQRLGLAAALLHNPDLLILDEPTSGIDPAGMIEIRELLKRLAGAGTTVFLSSHLLHEIEQTCDRVAVLHHGEIVAQGKVQDLLGASETVRVRTSTPEAVASALAQLEGVRNTRTDGAFVEVDGVSSQTVIRHLVQCDVIPDEVFYARTDLESIFTTLTQ